MKSGDMFGCHTPMLLASRSMGPKDVAPYPIMPPTPENELVKNSPARRETWVRSQGLEDPLEKGMATHSSILARRFPCTV